MLKTTFLNLIKKYSDNNNVANNMWSEIESHYTNKKRYYHTLKHLEELLNHLLNVKDKIQNWETILFSLYYHDIIYNSLKSDNEVKSAEFAKKQMMKISVPSQIINSCKKQIIATKDHAFSQDNDTNYFIDADLSILGQEWSTYKNYIKHIRKEYSIFPNIIYKKARKKVINHFLEMERIYKTNYFFDKFEQEAKTNLKKELEI